MSPGTAEPVRCLSCHRVYAQAASGTTVARNPGCPGCGYVGWVAAAAPPRRGSAAGPPRPSALTPPK